MLAFIAIARPKYTGRPCSQRSWSTSFFAPSRSRARSPGVALSLAMRRYISLVSHATLHQVFASSSLCLRSRSLRNAS